MMGLLAYPKTTFNYCARVWGTRTEALGRIEQETTHGLFPPTTLHMLPKAWFGGEWTRNGGEKKTMFQLRHIGELIVFCQKEYN